LGGAANNLENLYLHLKLLSELADTIEGRLIEGRLHTARMDTDFDTLIVDRPVARNSAATRAPAKSTTL
jgi:hypothetical protein